jgi:osmoprotectant transport system ATP-binding protein
MIILEKVEKKYADSLALKPLSLRFEKGKTTSLVGPSGCGKSTLLRLLIGLIVPDAGTITIDDQPLTPQNLIKTRKKMGYVIQEGGLFPHFTARANISVAASAERWTERRIQTRIEELLELAHFPGELLERHPSELSGGQRQRVSLMRALMLDPEILLLDEPLGALDPIIRRELQDELRAVFRRLKKTVVFVTHDFGEASFFGDQIVLMREGVVVQVGSPREFLEKPAHSFVERFVHAQRSPTENLES